jgi:hypothetical protein
MAHISSIGAGIFSDLSVAAPATDYTNANFATFISAATWQAIFADEVITGLSGATNGYVRLANVRSYPSIGAPSNIINVASFGSKASKQINGQADSQTIEITVNFISSEWDASSKLLATFLNDGKYHAFRFSLLNASPTNFSKGNDSLTASAAAGSGYSIVLTGAPPATVEIGQQVWSTGGSPESLGTITAIVGSTLTMDTIQTYSASATFTTKGIGQVPNSQWYFYGKLEALLINPQLTDANTATLTLSVASDFYGPYTL